MNIEVWVNTPHSGKQRVILEDKILVESAIKNHVTLEDLLATLEFYFNNRISSRDDFMKWQDEVVRLFKEVSSAATGSDNIISGGGNKND